MKAISIIKGTYTSRTTGEESTKLVVVFNNGEELFLFLNKPEFKDATLEETIAIIKANKSVYLNEITVSTNTYGQRQAQFSVLSNREEL